MKLLSTCMLMTYGSSFVFAQNKPVLIAAENKTNPALILLPNPDAILLPDNSFVINEFTDQEANLSYYNTQGKVWSNKIAMKYKPFKGSSNLRITSDRNFLSPYAQRNSFLVASNSGSFIYYIEVKPGKYSKKPQYIHQINRSGYVKSQSIESKEEMGEGLQTVFADDNYLYYLSTLNGNETLKRKKSEEKLILNRFDASDFSYKRYVLDVPAVPEGDNTTFWMYVGQTATEKFLVLKNVDDENEKVLLTVAAFNAEGKVTRTFTIDPKLDKNFIRPAHNVRSPVGIYYKEAEFDYIIKEHKPFMMIAPTNGGFVNVNFDPVSESFYVSGLFGPKPFKKVASHYTGFYVMKYNTNGEMQWKLEQPGSSALINDSFFKVHATPGFRNIFLKVLPDKSFYFSIQAKKKLYAHEITSEGKLSKTYVKQDWPLPTEPYVLNVGTMQ